MAEISLNKNKIDESTGEVKRRGQIASIWFRFKKNKLALAGLIIFVALVIIAFISPLILDYETDIITQEISNRFQGPSLEHLFGTDQFGRDIFKRILWGSRTSMFVGIGVVAISLGGGAIIGSISGYYEGSVADNVLMRLCDMFLAIPGTLLAIALVSAFGNSIPNLMLALGIRTLPKRSRIVRSSVLSLKNQEFVEAAISCGTSDARIMFRHILPNAVGPMIVEGTLSVARSIISIASMSFIGLGIQPPNPEWGAMLSEAKTQMINYPYLVYAPGFAIVLTVMSLTLIGDGLRDALDPKMKN